MAVLWVCILTSECSLRGAGPVPLERECSPSHNQVAGSPAEPALSKRPVYPGCPLWTPASCLQQSPNYHLVTENSVPGLPETAKGDIKRARLLTREATRGRSGVILEQAPLCPHRPTAPSLPPLPPISGLGALLLSVSAVLQN